MMDLIVAFTTGLTAGGLSCLAVQGGLLASSFAQQAEKDIQRKTAISTQPVLSFLLAKVMAYTLLGFALGALGSLIQLSPFGQGLLQIAVGVFMLGMALNMFEVHPIFRYFVIEPPKAITRFIRHRAREGTADDIVTSAFLGALTVLIPCGVTQAMMAAALATGNALAGAALMFAFTLGTTPIFFAFAYFAKQLGDRLHERFIGVVATLLILIGLTTLDGGLNLAGSPITLSSLTNFSSTANASPVLTDASLASTAVPTSATGAITSGSANAATARIQVLATSYTPSLIKAKANQPLRLELVTSQSFG